MRIHFEHNVRVKSQRLADLQNKTAELERQLSDTRVSLERELAQLSHTRETGAGDIPETRGFALADPAGEPDAGRACDPFASPEPSGDADSAAPDAWAPLPDERTEVLVNHGRSSTYSAGLPRKWKITIAAAFFAVLVTVLVMVLSGGGAAWPSSVAAVESEAARACLNPDVKSEPGQVDFACAKTTRQVLWVFALMTSGGNPDFADPTTGRMGLEPITPAQGGEVAWSLNLHSPYDPANPIDSIEVAARAINNIIGGATLTGDDGNVVVQPGLESNAANCARYTGSAAVISRKDFPSLCAKPVSSMAGQGALVADAYKKWVVTAPPKEAEDAAVLFENAKNPGDPRVQAILRDLSKSNPPS